MEPSSSKPSDEARVLVIYTGGTIGMLVSAQGYVPEPFFLTETLRSQKRFHDPLQDSLFSNAASVAEGVYQARLPSLVTPRSITPGHGGGKRIRYAILEWNPLLDSSNIEIHDWIRIATEIELNYSAFDAFVVLHGTDTMSYSSSALSFLLEDLGKTVILTGAQIPLSQLRNDAVDNLLGALSIAGNYIIPECSLYFNHTLYRGNRVSKVSSYDLNAFHSPNFPPLVNVGIDIVVNWNDVLRQTSLRRFKAHKGSSSSFLATLRLFPGMNGATVRSFLSPPTRGVVLETFGAGNAPQRTDLMEALKQACDAGIVIVAITQCAKGSVSDTYETGRTLQQAGVVPGGDMTPECALTKLGYLLSKPELSVQQVRELISMPLRGELTRQTLSAPSQPTTAPDLPSIQGLLTQFVRITNAARQTPQITLSPSDKALVAIPGGIVNCADAGSGRSPLHVAAINGSTASVSCLLESGALVHLRDTLGHTALYYAARQGHEEIVDTLVSAGANLGGMEYEAGYAELALKNALGAGDRNALNVWRKSGMDMPVPDSK
ncbi:hypothetical protein HYDPIDRAFT_123159 [Hydnomerulius pinastri MD-312]|nr:hypothetical protein HYDPIDRAFT_123159 [Hydnomerulius pinastri MD-312]